MNLASTAKAPPVPRFQAWGDSPNAYPVNKPRMLEESPVPMSWSLVLGEIDDLLNAQFQNRTASLTNDDIYALGCGFIRIGTAGDIDVLRRYVPWVRFADLDVGFSQPTIVNTFVAFGDNTTFSLPPVSTPFREDLADLRSMVLAINQGVTFPRSAQFEDLLDRALAKRGTPRDIDDWARRLAENVVNLDD